MIGPIVSAEIESLVFGTEPQIPIAGDQKPMGVAEVVIERVPIAKPSVVMLIIAVEGVGGLVVEDFGGILVFVGRGRVLL